jgi:truncated hemoglobin YjbI
MDLFERIGGETLRRVLEDFYDRVYDDPMIGYMFAASNKQRLIRKEWELVSRMLGSATTRYTGMPMPKAHARHRIMGGHFDRRQRLLEEVLEEHGVDPEVRAAWRRHNLAMRAQITADDEGACVD